MLVIDRVDINGRFIHLGTEILAESLARRDCFSKIEMHHVGYSPQPFRGRLCQSFEFLDGQCFDATVRRRTVLDQPCHQCAAPFLVPHVRIEHVRWQAAEGDFVGRIEKHFWNAFVPKNAMVEKKVRSFTSDLQ